MNKLKTVFNVHIYFNKRGGFVQFYMYILLFEKIYKFEQAKKIGNKKISFYLALIYRFSFLTCGANEGAGCALISYQDSLPPPSCASTKFKTRSFSFSHFPTTSL